MRIGDRRGEHRFVVADYKTNALHQRGTVPTPDDYGPTRLAAAMADHDYPLQALLYSVALHRYLRWRLPGYEPDLHLGGAAYLFLRGMAGSSGPASSAPAGSPEPAWSEEGPATPGVFAWPLPPRLVVGLSDLLDGRRVPVLVS